MSDRNVAARPIHWWRTPTLAVAAALVVAAAGACGNESTIEARILAAPDASLVSVAGPQVEEMEFIWSVSEAGGVLRATSLESPGPGRIHQFWFIGGEEPRSGGTFSPDDAGAVRYVARSDNPESITQIAITIEPDGGSTLPTAPWLLGAMLI